jgi:hypothetical protein
MDRKDRKIHKEGEITNPWRLIDPISIIEEKI